VSFVSRLITPNNTVLAVVLVGAPKSTRVVQEGDPPYHSDALFCTGVAVSRVKLDPLK